jgi:mRNA interferase MazF
VACRPESDTRSEQAGVRPVVVFQHDVILKFSSTFLAIPLTTNLKRAALPTSVRINQGDGGLDSTSVALCHQLRVLDKTRLVRRLGLLSPVTIERLDACVLFTLVG